MGRALYCPGDGEECLDLPQLERMFAESRDTDELLDLWTGLAHHRAGDAVAVCAVRRNWPTRACAISGSADLGELWRAGYDMPPDEFTVELERLWNQVRPLYESLHCQVRGLAGRRVRVGGGAGLTSRFRPTCSATCGARRGPTCMTSSGRRGPTPGTT